MGKGTRLRGSNRIASHTTTHHVLLLLLLLLLLRTTTYYYDQQQHPSGANAVQSADTATAATATHHCRRYHRGTTTATIPTATATATVAHTTLLPALRMAWH